MGAKGPRGSGSQFNPKGMTQGTTLVDPKSGQPIDVKTDALGVRRLAVDANVTANISGVEVALDGVGPTGDNVSIVDNVTGDKFKVHSDGSIDANVEVDAQDGDNIGLKIQDRNNSPSDSQYSKRVTAKTGTTNTDTTSMDVSLHDHQGNEFTQANPFQISTNYEKIIDVVLKSAWMKLAVYDQVITSVSSDRQTITLDFREDGNMIGKAFINFTSDLSWNFTLERYLLEDDGSILLDDDDSSLFLE